MRWQWPIATRFVASLRMLKTGLFLRALLHFHHSHVLTQPSEVSPVQPCDLSQLLLSVSQTGESKRKSFKSFRKSNVRRVGASTFCTRSSKTSGDGINHLLRIHLLLNQL